ncbi:MAG: ABC transporter permease [Candidatus Babeliales bacterium]
MKKLWYDTRLIFWRSVQISLRKPIWIMFGLFQPICYLLLFSPLLERTGIAGAGHNALTIFVPGLLVMISLLGPAFVGFRLIDDTRAGVIDRLRVAPIDRRAIWLGRVLRDVLLLMVQTSFLLTLAWLVGLRAPLLGVFISLGIVALIGATMAMTSYTLAFILRDEDGFAPLLQFFLLPLQLLAGTMLPLTLAPLWLQRIAFFNPLSHCVAAIRALFMGNYIDMVVLYGYASIALAALVAFTVASSVFNRRAQ